MPNTSAEPIVYEISDTHQIFLISEFRIEFWFFRDAERGPTALYHFDHINSQEIKPIRVQFAAADDFAHARKMASVFLRHWSEQYAESGCTGVVPFRELEPDIAA
jgi:hypothetical protein